MTDYAFGVAKVNGFTATGYESLTSNFEFITIELANDLRTVAQGGSSSSQAALDKLIQIVSERGQPIIMGSVGWSSPNSTVILAIEHPYAWQSTATSSSTPSYSSTGILTAADPRASEDLASKIAADGVNYSLSVVTITFSNILT